DVPPLPSLGEKVEDLKSFNRWQTRLQDLESSLGQYEGFDAVADLDSSPLKQTRDRFAVVSEFYSKLVALEFVIDQTRTNLDAAESEEARVLSEFQDLGVCPTCSQDITPEGHAH